jgi:regulator of sigma E protease
MDYLQALQSLSPTVLLFAIAGLILALFVIIFVHEFGHFIVGRWCGVKIETFSVGFGKELFGFTDRYNTRWKFCLIQLGGYVKFEGDANAASMPSNTEPANLSPTSLQAQPVWQRMAIVAAGPIANFLLAIAIFAAALMALGTPYMRPVVTEVIANSAAERAGMKVGDTVKSMGGREINTYRDVQEYVLMRPEETFVMTVERVGQKLDLTITVDANEVKDGFGGTLKVGKLGIKHEPSADEPLMRYYAPHEAVVRAVDRTWLMISTTAKFFGKIIVGQQSVKQIGGPIMMGKGAGEALSNGPTTFIMFIGFLSISVGIINLFPIPMLDGGHLVFYAIEAVRGKPLGPVAQEWGFRIGFSCVVALMLLGFFNDSGRVFNLVFGS